MLPELEGRDSSSLRAIPCGGSAVPRALSEAYRTQIGLPLLQAWGMTETSPICAVAHLDVDEQDLDEDTKADLRTMVGRINFGVEMRVVDPDTREEVAERHVGELLLRGTSVTPGYYKRDDATAALFHDGWLCTGDLAYVLDGELVLCGRIKDVIIVGGRNVFPEDIERAVGGLGGVRAGNVIAFGQDG
ncbi:MAG: class I adenylate-forming enzyme family protein, partial [Ilumatobacteraceae bacterium]